MKPNKLQLLNESNFGYRYYIIPRSKTGSEGLGSQKICLLMESEVVECNFLGQIICLLTAEVSWDKELLLVDIRDGGLGHLLHDHL